MKRIIFSTLFAATVALPSVAQDCLNGQQHGLWKQLWANHHIALLGGAEGSESRAAEIRNEAQQLDACLTPGDQSLWRQLYGQHRQAIISGNEWRLQQGLPTQEVPPEL